MHKYVHKWYKYYNTQRTKPVENWIKLFSNVFITFYVFGARGRYVLVNVVLPCISAVLTVLWQQPLYSQVAIVMQKK